MRQVDRTAPFELPRVGLTPLPNCFLGSKFTSKLGINTWLLLPERLLANSRFVRQSYYRHVYASLSFVMSREMGRFRSLYPLFIFHLRVFSSRQKNWSIVIYLHWFPSSYGQPSKRELCFDNIKVSASAWDTNLAAANPKFLSVKSVCRSTSSISYDQKRDDHVWG
jgi:hypothetical protein